MGPTQIERGDVQGADELGPDWNAELRAYVEEHSRYPEQATMNGDQGDSMVLFTVSSDGTVKAVSLEQSAGSPWLDMELLSVFRHAHLPPFPPGTDKSELTLHFTIHFILGS